MVETRLEPEIDDCHVEIQGYSLLREDTNLGGGGGFLSYVKNNLKAKEYIFCSAWSERSPPALVVLIYRPPDVLVRSDRQLIRLLR